MDFSHGMVLQNKELLEFAAMGLMSQKEVDKCMDKVNILVLILKYLMVTQKIVDK